MKLFNEHRSWARNLAGIQGQKRNVRGFDLDCMRNEGELALWDCCKRWDPDLCAKGFREFAYRRVIGAAIDYLRDELAPGPRLMMVMQTQISALNSDDQKFIERMRVFSVEVGHEIEVRETIEILRRLVPPGRRTEVFELLLAGLTQKEISVRLGVSEGSIAVTCKNIKDLLRSWVV